MPRLAVGHAWANCVFVLRNLQIFDFLVAVAFVAAQQTCSSTDACSEHLSSNGTRPALLINVF